MTLLSPLALLWLLGIPVLVWLWRLAAAQRRTTVSSLAPFEHLLKRAPRHRSRLTVNLLFWLQLAGLAGVALALARPVIQSRSGATVLAILDTSAGLEARQRGGTAFKRAQGALRSRLARKAPMTRVLLVTTAPPAAVTGEPTSDGLALNAAVDAQRTVAQGGRLATAARLGRALLGHAPDEIWVATDEPKPQAMPEGVQWLSAGRAVANTAIIGVDTAGALCEASGSRIVVSLQRFAGAPASGVVLVQQEGRELARAGTTFTPGARQSVALDVPADASGWMEIAVESAGDGLAIDDRAWVDMRQGARRPIQVRIGRPALRQTVTEWLAACPALQWSQADTPSGGAGEPPGNAVLLTDDASEAADAGVPALIFSPPNAPAVPSHWTIAADHPLGAYLSPISVVSAPMARDEGAVAGTPVVSALVGGRAVPVLVADERSGTRRVTLRADPTGLADSVPLLVMFFNSVRWLMDESRPKTTQEGLVVGGWDPGPVTVQRPDGSRTAVPSVAGLVHLEDAAPGLYRLSQGSKDVTAAVNFLDPLESNTYAPVSTWQAPEDGAAAAPSAVAAASPRAGAGRVPTHHLASVLMVALLVLLVAEWLLYGARRRSAG